MEGAEPTFEAIGAAHEMHGVIQVPSLYRRGEWAVTPSLIEPNRFVVTHVPTGTAASNYRDAADINSVCELCRRLEPVTGCSGPGVRPFAPANIAARDIYRAWVKELSDAR